MTVADVLAVVPAVAPCAAEEHASANVAVAAENGLKRLGGIMGAIFVVRIIIN
ncbi:hypothetical protein GHA01_26800 [Novacetimonas hansenii]|uniref:Uncharacterized protein n=2 Tax=Novacetimonas hansenii TaxID=436 RepID=A0ABQ0SHD9_NOVHA|nr:hypothetical protein GXY_03413 [Novacetimonas hansenii ATCC 23769]GAN82667.1 hypothetical protein Gaha_0030_022 [Novacetimonas hansenii JCM 7643]GEC64831.1 hypothetical protein GHA01_26800 [Novacetimonas hansenii]